MAGARAPCPCRSRGWMSACNAQSAVRRTDGERRGGWEGKKCHPASKCWTTGEEKRARRGDRGGRRRAH